MFVDQALAMCVVSLSRTNGQKVPTEQFGKVLIRRAMVLVAIPQEIQTGLLIDVIIWNGFAQLQLQVLTNCLQILLDIVWRHDSFHAD